MTPIQAAYGVARQGLRPAIPSRTPPKLAQLIQVGALGVGWIGLNTATSRSCKGIQDGMQSAAFVTVVHEVLDDPLIMASNRRTTALFGAVIEVVPS